jgi:octaheme c-type cytochrome (tetrathionate reductase family)
MLRNISLVIIGLIVSLVMVNIFQKEDHFNLKLEELKHLYTLKAVPSVNHNKLPALQKKFKTPQEVTQACLSCHTETHKEVMASSHWNWERATYVEGRGISSAGKKNVMNNFCLGTNSNQKSCAKCHIGYGMTSSHYDFNNARNVDCMVCHDNSEEYLKGASMAGYPDRTVNLENVALSVGSPRKSNCGSCHSFGGGGNNVKHGDLDVALNSCTREVDVHMGANGMNLECVACHTARNHNIIGKLYSVSQDNTNRATCEQCHTTTPHFSEVLNRHGSRVSCQTCHIPRYAKVNSTKMSWKWSDAGKLKNGKPYEDEDSLGNHNYMSIKGSFVWKRDVIPDYIWFNGTADQYILGDTIKSVPVKMNTLNGSHHDHLSKIIPVKIHVGDQIYDKVFNRLVQPKLYGEAEGDSAFWKDFKWEEAVAAGMKESGFAYSGQYGFVETVMYWPVNHMVSPKEESVGCAECHTRTNGRLAKLTGFYLPGRDSNKTQDNLGYWMLILTLMAVFGHAIVRILSNIYRNKFEKQIISYEEDKPDE